MAAFDIVTWTGGTNGHQKRTPSAATQFDFASIRLGTSLIVVKESASAAGNLDFGNTRLTLVSDPVNAQDAATKAYADAALALKANAADVIRKDGTVAFTGAQSMGGFKLTSLADPTAAQDAATKNYVDSVASGLDPKAAVNLATTAALPANTYSNGTNGVGATLTATANGVLANVDGVAPVAGYRLLVQNEATAANNGIYIVTQLGSASTPYILTRSGDANSATSITSGLYTLTIAGTVNKGYGFVLTSADPLTIGTTALTFMAFSSPIVTLTAGDGIAISGFAISADYTRSLINDNASAVTKSQVVYIKANGHVDLAIAQTVSNAFELGIVYDASIASTSAGKVTIRRGAVVPGFTGLTVGAPVYVSRSAAGAVTQDISTFVAGEFIYRVGYAVSATEVVYNPAFILEY